ncbi:YceD family protein [Salisediminibacterium halotolerans]|uniref:DUF177 domain-containing protein n=1 Tax=Salisediminibacterium halotolerans TaxID=517425 RepID=A0A1H9PTI4_9BACI|nr:YceD family protein [Salisediminibacterium haloalkalitolerans]SER51527.1 uncharacterized protein SAMN05444126_10227 [Salisediminibacterium haloalkalitolerans]
MKWSVQQLQSLRHKGLQVNESVELNELSTLDPEVRDVTPVHVKGEASFVDGTVTFRLAIEGALTLPCARTLNDVVFPFYIEADEMFQLDGKDAADEENDVHEPEGQTVDLKPYIQERILLEKPLRVFSENQDGPAPPEGDGWELQVEEEPTEEDEKAVDPRLKELGKFFDKD